MIGDFSAVEPPHPNLLPTGEKEFFPTLICCNAKAKADRMKQGDIEGMSFEAALAELEKIVKSLEQGQAPLDESIELYQRGDKLKRHCEARLKAAQARIEQISIGPDGQPSGTTAFDAR